MENCLSTWETPPLNRKQADICICIAPAWVTARGIAGQLCPLHMIHKTDKLALMLHTGSEKTAMFQFAALKWHWLYRVT